MTETGRKIIVCPMCKGVGMVARLNKDNTPYLYHGQPVTEVCPNCDGEGRVLAVYYAEYFRMKQNIIDVTSDTEQTKRRGLRDIFTKKK